MDLTQLNTLLQHVQPALLVMFRIGGLALFAPVLASPLLPVRMRILLVAMLGLASYPVLASTALTAPPVGQSLLDLVVAVGAEAMVGMLIGLAASLPLVAAQTGGLIMGQQMGLGFARFYNPDLGEEADVLEQIFFLTLLAVFLAAGGLDAIVGAILGSFEALPAGTVLHGLFVERDVPSLLASLLLAAFELALRVSAPLLALVFLETVILGFLAKTVPQLNVLSLGFPIRIIVGLGVIILALGPIGTVLIDGAAGMLQAIELFVQNGTGEATLG